MTFRQIAMTAMVVGVGGAAVFAATPLARDLMYHLVPIRWTGEAKRIAEVLGIGPGSVVADVGGGDGALIVELAHIVGPGGRAIASERTVAQRQLIAERAVSSGVQVRVIEAGEQSTNLDEGCCDAITMRMVMHHIGDRPAFARELRRAIKPGGRVAIIDFAPGALPHLGPDHGVGPDQVAAMFDAAGFELVTRNDRWGGRNFLIVFQAR